MKLLDAAAKHDTGQKKLVAAMAEAFHITEPSRMSECVDLFASLTTADTFKELEEEVRCHARPFAVALPLSPGSLRTPRRPLACTWR